jgi:hypothetical protein
MLTRVNKVLIGKDVDRTAALVGGATMATVIGNIVEGEIVALDKSKKVLTAGATVSDSDTIFLCEGTGETYDYTNETGTQVTSARKIIFSDPIEGAKVKTYNGNSYSAKSEQSTAISVSGLSTTASTEYILRFVYKDLSEHPGQFVHSYRIIATGTLDTDMAALAAKVNAHKGRRVNASYNTSTDTITLAARPIPESTTSVNDIDEFSMVHFSAFLNYVNSSGNWVEWNTSITDTARSYGNGTWEQVRDMEKFAQGYKGVFNRIHFPIIKPDFRTVKDATYDLVVIEHDKSYQSPDNQYVKQTPLTTVVAITVPSSGTQMATLLGQLNPWFASLPGAFPAISV